MDSRFACAMSSAAQGLLPTFLLWKTNLQPALHEAYTSIHDLPGTQYDLGESMQGRSIPFSIQPSR